MNIKVADSVADIVRGIREVAPRATLPPDCFSFVCLELADRPCWEGYPFASRITGCTVSGKAETFVQAVKGDKTNLSPPSLFI